MTSRVYNKGGLISFATKIVAAWDDPDILIGKIKSPHKLHSVLFQYSDTRSALHRRLRISYGKLNRIDVDALPHYAEKLDEVRTFFINNVALHGYRHSPSEKHFVMKAVQDDRTIGFEVTVVHMTTPGDLTSKDPSFEISPFVVLNNPPALRRRRFGAIG